VTTDYGDRNIAIAAIRAALKERTGKTWSVRGGRGTGWGWITITAPPKRLEQFDYMSEADRTELGEALGLEGPVHHQGQMIAAGSDYRREYVARAQGRTPPVYGRPYWD
jgi:predicted Zn-dependent protease